MRKIRGTVGLKAISLNMLDRRPISLRAVYEQQKIDAEGNLLNGMEESVNDFFFREVTVEELLKLRLNRKPAAVYKIDRRFYYTEIPGNLKLIRLSETTGPHLCGKNCTNVCKDCPKTYDLTTSFQERIGRSFPYSVLESWRIEKYDFVTEGVEAFNMPNQNDAFVVLKCQDYEVSRPRSIAGNRTVADLKVGLANFWWDDFDGDLKAMRKRINSHKNKKTG